MEVSGEGGVAGVKFSRELGGGNFNPARALSHRAGRRMTPKGALRRFAPAGAGKCGPRRSRLRTFRGRRRLDNESFHANRHRPRRGTTGRRPTAANSFAGARSNKRADTLSPPAPGRTRAPVRADPDRSDPRGNFQSRSRVEPPRRLAIDPRGHSALLSPLFILLPFPFALRLSILHPSSFILLPFPIRPIISS